jgi:hypothetical protein
VVVLIGMPSTYLSEALVPVEPDWRVVKREITQFVRALAGS